MTTSPAFRALFLVALLAFMGNLNTFVQTTRFFKTLSERNAGTPCPNGT